MQGVLGRAHCHSQFFHHRVASGRPAVRVRIILCYSGGKRCGAAAGQRERTVAVRARGEAGVTGEDEDERGPRSDVVGAAAGGAKRGTVVGAVALVIGTSIGSGILAVPQRTAPAGFIPSAACMVICWAFLVIEALLLAEINVHLLRKRKKDGGGGGGGGGLDVDVISVKSMAQETLGEWGGNLAATAYLFLSYTSMVAYASKSGEVLSRVIDVPEPVSGSAFTAALALLIAAGGTGVTTQVNQLLTFFMIGLLLTIEVSAVALGGGLSLPATSAHWEQVPPTLPVIIFTLVYHDIAPVICAYLDGDLARIRLSIMVGSLVPLLSLLVWNDIALSISTDLDGFDILNMLKTEWGYTVVQTFSLLAVGTSLIGTLLGASQFFFEQITNLEKTREDTSVFLEEDGTRYTGWRTLLETNGLSYVATGLVVIPTMLIAANVQNSFFIATDIAGGYCMTILYGVLPPLMAWSIGSKLTDPIAGIEEAAETSSGRVDFTSAKPVLVGTGVFFALMVFQQILQDLGSLNSSHFMG